MVVSSSILQRLPRFAQLLAGILVATSLAGCGTPATPVISLDPRARSGAATTTAGPQAPANNPMVANEPTMTNTPMIAKEPSVATSELAMRGQANADNPAGAGAGAYASLLRAKEPLSGSTLCERLGYAPDAKLLILNTDDVGLSESTNRAVIEALESGVLSSGSVMVPAPAFPEIAMWARRHPRANLGVHIDLTSEWESWRWGPVVPFGEVPALVQPDHTFFKTSAEAARAPLVEIEREVRAQIDRAIAEGLDLTHLDAHMGSMYATSEVFSLLVELAGEYRLPFVLSRDWFDVSEGTYLGRTMADFPDHVVMLETSVGADERVPVGGWANFYDETIRNLRPGVSQIFIHVAFDDDETRMITAGHDGWNAAWRQRDFDWVTSARLRDVLRETKTTVVSWRDLRNVIRGETLRHH